MYIPALLLFSAFLYHLIICNKYASAKDSKFLLLLERRMPENQLSWLPDTQAREEGCFCPKKAMDVSQVDQKIAAMTVRLSR